MMDGITTEDQKKFLGLAGDGDNYSTDIKTGFGAQREIGAGINYTDFDAFDDKTAREREARAQASVQALFGTDISNFDDATAQGFYQSVSEGIFGIPDQDGTTAFGKRASKDPRQNIDLLRRFCKGEYSLIEDPEYTKWKALDDEGKFQYALSNEGSGEKTRSFMKGERGAGFLELLGAMGQADASNAAFISDEMREIATKNINETVRRLDYDKLNDEEKAAYRADTIVDYEKKLSRRQVLANFLQVSQGLSDRGGYLLAKSFNDGTPDLNIETLDPEERDKVYSAFSMMRGDQKKGHLLGIPTDFTDDTAANRLQLGLYGLQQSVLGLVTDTGDLARDVGIWAYSKTVLSESEREDFFKSWDATVRAEMALKQDLPEADTFVGEAWQGVMENLHWFIPYSGIGKGKALMKGAAKAGELKKDAELLSAAKAVAEAGAKSIKQKWMLDLNGVQKLGEMGSALLARQMGAVERYSQALKAVNKELALASKWHDAAGASLWTAGEMSAFSAFAGEYVASADAAGISREDSILTAAAIGLINARIERLYVPGLESSLSPAQVKSLTFQALAQAIRSDGAKGALAWIKNRVVKGVTEGTKVAVTEGLIEEPLQQLAQEHGKAFDKLCADLRASGEDTLANEAQAIFKSILPNLPADYKTYVDTAADMFASSAGFGFMTIGNMTRRQTLNNFQMRHATGNANYDEGIADVIQRAIDTKTIVENYWKQDVAKDDSETQSEQSPSNPNRFMEAITAARQAFRDPKTGDYIREIADAADVDIKTAEVIAQYLQIESEAAAFSPQVRAFRDIEMSLADLDESTIATVMPGYIKGSYAADTEHGIYSGRVRLADGSERTIAYRIGDFSEDLRADAAKNAARDSAFGKSFNVRHAEMGDGQTWEKLCDAQRYQTALDAVKSVNGYSTGAGVFEMKDKNGETVRVNADDVIRLSSGRLADIGYGAAATQATVRHETFHSLWRFVRASMDDADVQALAKALGVDITKDGWEVTLDETMAHQLERYASGHYVAHTVSSRFDKMLDGWAGNAIRFFGQFGMADEVKDSTGKSYTLKDFYDRVLRGELGSGKLGVDLAKLAPEASTPAAQPGATGANLPVEVTETDRAAQETEERTAMGEEESDASKTPSPAPTAPTPAPAAPITSTLENPADASQPNQRFYRIGLPNSDVKIVGHLEVVDALDGLITSTDEAYGDRGNQNRDDKSEESRALVEKIGANPDPLQLGTVQPVASNGIAWMLPNRNVIIGNHRMNGVRLAYAKATASALDHFVREDAAKRGIEIPSSVTRPITVFVLDRIESPDSKVDQHEVVRLANESQNRGFNVREQAGNDAKILLDKNLLPRLTFRPDGRIDETKSGEAIGVFRQESGAQGMIAEDGSLTEEGQTRLQNAALAALLGGTGSKDLLQKIMANAKRLEMANELRALMKVTPELISVAQEKPPFDLRDALADALQLFTEWRDKDESLRLEKGKTKHDWYKTDKDTKKRLRGLSWEAFMSQGDMFRTPTPEAKILGDLFARAQAERSFDREDIESEAGKKRGIDLISNYLSDYIANARAANTEVDMFGTPPASRADILATQRAKGNDGPRFSMVGEGVPNYQAQYDAVVAHYTNKDGTKKPGWMKAPNGKLTNLTERQWVQVRTPAFKAWFGDWELATMRDILDGSPAMSVSTEAVPSGGFAEVRDWATKIFNEQGGIAKSPMLGDVILDGQSVRDSQGHGKPNRFKKATFPAVKSVIEKGVLILNQEEKGRDSYYVAAPISIDGVPNIVVALIHKRKEDNRFYLHSVGMKSRLIDGSVSGSSENEISLPSTNPSTSDEVSILKSIFAVNPENVSKVVDENGEPKVVAHSTNAIFNTFEKTQVNDAGWLGKGFYFFGDRSLDGQYGRNVMETFLNIRDPYYLSEEEHNDLVEKNNNDASSNFSDEVRENGYDGVFYNGDLNQEWAAFAPTQIKSATDNTGAFDQANPDIRYSILGEKGITNLKGAQFVADSLGIAREMETAQKDAKTIRLATGWERGADGKWRYEIPDKEVKDDWRRYLARSKITLKDIIENSELFNAYPELKDLKIRFHPNQDGRTYGSYDDEYKVINIHTVGSYNQFVSPELIDVLYDNKDLEVLGKDVVAAKSIDNDIALRRYGKNKDRIENAKARREELIKKIKTAVGSKLYNKLSSSQFRRIVYVEDAINDVKRLKKATTLSDINSTLLHEVQHAIQHIEGFAGGGNVLSAGGFDQYRRLAGEVESRNVQSRHNLTPDERRERTLAETEDVAREDQIILDVANEAQTRYSIASMDADYMAAVQAGDMETAQRMVNEAASQKGYTSDDEFRMSHRAPVKDDDNFNKNIKDLAEDLAAGKNTLVPTDYWTKPEWYMDRSENSNIEAFNKIRNAILKFQEKGKAFLRVYRAVPKDVKDTRLRVGDWIIPSRAYADEHGKSNIQGSYRIIQASVSAEHLYWDANDIREWGYDDGKNYAYRNTKNNRKLLDPVTYDNDGKVIPLSKRFNLRNSDVRFSVVAAKAVEDIATNGHTVIRSKALGDVIYGLGKEGKGGRGLLHIIESRRRDGATLDEAAETAVRVGISVSEGELTKGRYNTFNLDYDGVRAIVARDKDTKQYVVTGFVIDADENAAALRRAKSLRTVPHVSSEEVVAALKRVVYKLRSMEDSVAYSPEDDNARFSVVTDKKKIDALNKEETVSTYRAMAKIGDEYYPPMATKLKEPDQKKATLQPGASLSDWFEADERPDLAEQDENGEWYFPLRKSDGKTIRARYNPYIHTSYTPFNDQFASAQDREDIVIVEMAVPKSELTSGYKAEKAKDAVGEMEWKAGKLTGKLTGTRKVVLSRWAKLVREVPYSEVADKVQDIFPSDMIFPSNVVHPELRHELEARGRKFVETDNSGRERFSFASESRFYDGDLFSFPPQNDLADLMREKAATTAARDAVQPWPENFPKVMLQTTLANIKKKWQDLHTRAKGGEEAAAEELLHNILGDEMVGKKPNPKWEKMRAFAAEHPNARIVAVHAEEATGRNRIPIAYAHYIEAITGLEVEDRIVQTVRAFHTGAVKHDRMTRRAAFDGPVTPGAEYILVDDHVTMGGTLNDLRKHIQRGGGKVIGITTLTASQFSDTIAPSRQTIQKLRDTFGEQLDELIKATGIANGADELTEAEARSIGKLLSDAAGNRSTPSGREGVGQTNRRAHSGALREESRFSLNIDGPGAVYPQFVNTLSDDELIVAAVASRMALGTNEKSSSRSVSINSVQRMIARIHPEWDRDKQWLEAQRTYKDAQKFSKKIKADIDRGVSDSLILEHLPESAREVFGHEMRQEARAGQRLGVFGARVRSELEERQARIVETAVRVQTGIDADQIENTFGINLSETIMKLAENPLREKDDTPSVPTPTGDGETTADATATDPTLRDADAKIQAVVDEIVGASGEDAARDDTNRKNRRDAAKREEERQGESESDTTGGAGDGDIDGDALFEAVRKNALDLQSPRHLARFITELARRQWIKENGLPITANVWQDLVAVQFLRKTAQSVYTKLIKDLTYSRSRETAMSHVLKLDAAPSVAGLMSEMEFIGALINASRIRETQQQKCEQLDKFLREHFSAQGRFKPDKEEGKRKVSAEAELWARYMRHAMWLTPDAAAQESGELARTLESLATDFKDAERDVNQSREFVETVRKLNVLREFGSLRYKSLGEIDAAIQWWEDFERGASDDIMREMSDREIQTKKAAHLLAVAFTNPKAKTVKDGTTLKDRIGNFLSGHMGFNSLINDCMRFASDEDRAAVNDIVGYIFREIQKAGDRTATEKRRQNDAFYKAIETVYGKSFNSVMKEMTATDERFLPFMGEVGGKRVIPTKGRAMQLLVSLLQEGRRTEVDDPDHPGQKMTVWVNGYHDNIIRHGREGQARQLLAMMTPADLNMIKWLGTWYEQNRADLSKVCQSLFGIGVYAELPNYFPVKMMLEKQGLEKGSAVGWSIFPKALTPRVKNEHDFDTSADIFQMWAARMEEGAQWKHHAQLGLEMRGIFGRSELQSAVIASHGNHANDLMQSFITDILAGSGAIDRTTGGTTIFADEIRGWTALCALGGNVGVMLKQTTSIPAFGFEVGLVNVAKHMVTAFTPEGMAAMAKIFNSEQRKTRWDVGSSEAVMNALNNRDAGLLKRFFQAAMITNKLGDVVPTLVVGQGIYRDLLEQGRSEEDAMAEMWSIAERTQQSGRMENQINVQRRNRLGRAMYQFLSTNNQMLMYETRAIRELLANPKSAKRWKQFGTVMILNHVILTSAYYWMGELYKAMLGQEPPEDQLKDWVISCLLGSWGALMVFGFMCKATLDTAIKGYRFGRSSSMLPMEGWINTQIKDASKLANAIFDAEGSTYDEMLEAAGKWMSDLNSTIRDLSKIYRFRVKDEPQ